MKMRMDGECVVGAEGKSEKGMNAGGNWDKGVIKHSHLPLEVFSRSRWFLKRKPKGRVKGDKRRLNREQINGVVG